MVGGIGQIDGMSNGYRPVVTLISGTQITSGDGTVNNAYTVG